MLEVVLQQIPPAQEQLPTLLEGIVDINTREELGERLEAAYRAQRPLEISDEVDVTVDVSLTFAQAASKEQATDSGILFQ